MDVDYAQIYPQLFARHWWWRSRETVILDELQRLAPDSRWGTILDVGCGEGLFFETLSQFGEVEGVERGGPFPGEATESRWPIHRVAFRL
jgi:2-polyprenyl-3-methyl-5-hydroxy-6-metoxy-1,4-benzoquinol methylase